MRDADITERLQSAIANIDGSLERRIATLAAESRSQVNRVNLLLDELEREIDDLSDETAQTRLRRVLARLDCETTGITNDASGLATHDLFDPLRVLIVDLHHNY